MQRLFPDWQHLSLEHQIAQLFVVRTSGYLFDHQIRYPQWEATEAQLQGWVEQGVGGVIFLGGSAAELALKCQRLQEEAKVPLLMAADIEEGVGQRFSGATWAPPPMSLGAIACRDLPRACDLAQQFGAMTAREAKAVGLNWLLGPIVDVNNNPRNPVINVRAFGEDAATVSALTTAFIQGTQPHRILTSAKHFPGHGDTATDSHLALPVIPHTRDRLDAIELAPFRQAIAAGVSSIMTAHLLIPALDPDLPATLSPKILTGLLREEWDYDGLIVTDALVMQAISQRYGANEAPVLAFEAGADVLLMPVDFPGAVAAIAAAIDSERIPLARLHQSLERIWRAKMRGCEFAGHPSEACHAWETEAIPAIDLGAIATPDAHQWVDTILSESLQIQGSVPLVPLAGLSLTNLVIVDSLIDGSGFLGHHTPAIALPKSLGYQLQYQDYLFGTETLTPEMPVLLQLFIRGNPFRDSAGFTQKAIAWIQQLVTQDKLQGLVLYGSPYAWEAIAPLLPARVPAIFCYGQMPQAQTVALQRLFGQNQPDLPSPNLPSASGQLQNQINEFTD